MYSPYDFWQFWRNTEDLDVVKFLKLFTELSLEEINELSKLEGKDLNKAKIILANEVTKLCHGEENAKKSEEVAKDTFEKKSISNSLQEYLLSIEKINSGLDLPQLLLDASLCPSKSFAKKLILGNGARINNEVISDIKYTISENDFVDKKLLVSAGKKKHMLVRIK
ncbi:MAG: tyrosyl-tRNA synthetase [Candidatus Midichloriaceae bacterium]|jgi:tyrosyl-tRNA synthetase